MQGSLDIKLSTRLVTKYEDLPNPNSKNLITTIIIIKKHCVVELLLKRLNEKGKKKKKKKMVTVQGNKSLTYLTLKRQVGFKRDQSS